MKNSAITFKHGEKEIKVQVNGTFRISTKNAEGNVIEIEAPTEDIENAIRFLKDVEEKEVKK